MRFLLAYLLIAKVCFVFAQEDLRDASFNPDGTGANSVIMSMYVKDDKIVIGGWFSQYNNQPREKVARLNLDGSLDASFIPEITTRSDSWFVAPDDNKIIVSFIDTEENLIRLNADGSLDETFVSNIGSGPNNTVLAIAKQPDGKIVLGGGFTTFNSQPFNYLIRLHPDGTVDNTFIPNVNFVVRSIVLLENGEMILGGSDATNILTKLHADGTKDLSFNAGTFTSENNEPSIQIMMQQGDGKILIGGNFSTYSGEVKKNIVRISSDGSIDDTFDANFNAPILAFIPDGTRVIVGGLFTDVNGITSERMVVLDNAGGIYASYDTNMANVRINQGAVHQDKVIIAGSFGTIFGTNVGNIARLHLEPGRLQQSIDFGEIDPKTFGNAAFVLQATATSQLEVKFKSDNENVLRIEGKTATIVGAGTATVTASQAGDESYFQAAPVKRTVQVNKANQKIFFEAIPEAFVNDPPIALAASANSGLNLYYRSSDSAIAIVEGNMVTLKGDGETTITAYQDGNENFNAAFPVSKILRVKLVTGSETMNSRKLPIYPNPVSSNLYVERESFPAGRLLYRIYNTTNAIVSSGEMTSNKDGIVPIDMSQFSKGVYFLFIVSGEKHFFQKVIKK